MPKYKKQLIKRAIKDYFGGVKIPTQIEQGDMLRIKQNLKDKVYRDSLSKHSFAKICEGIRR